MSAQEKHSGLREGEAQMSRGMKCLGSFRKRRRSAQLQRRNRGGDYCLVSLERHLSTRQGRVS